MARGHTRSRCSRRGRGVDLGRPNPIAPSDAAVFSTLARISGRSVREEEIEGAEQSGTSAAVPISRASRLSVGSLAVSFARSVYSVAFGDDMPFSYFYSLLITRRLLLVCSFLEGVGL